MTHKSVFDYTITIDRIPLTLCKNAAALTLHGHHYVMNQYLAAYSRAESLAF